MEKRMKYNIEHIPFPTRGVLMTRAKRAAMMDEILASMAAEGLLPGWRFPEREGAEVSTTAMSADL
jgi:hypothetical protein